MRIAISRSAALLARLIDLGHQRGDYAGGIRPPVPVELPSVPSFGDQVEIAVEEEDFLVGTCLAQHLARGIECDAVAVIYVIPFLACPIQSGHEIFVEDGMRAQ